MDTDLIQKLWNKTEVKGDCWIWKGKFVLTRRERTYGYIHIDRRVKLIHRLSLCIYLKLNYDDQTWDACHLCQNKGCWNPLHLYAGTKKTNAMDRFKDMTHCRNGHEMNKVNTYINPRGNRYCRICSRKSAEIYRNKS